MKYLKYSLLSLCGLLMAGCGIQGELVRPSDIPAATQESSVQPMAQE